jgi:uncharacterized protein YjbJ (UPF0337 family)
LLDHPYIDDEEVPLIPERRLQMNADVLKGKWKEVNGRMEELVGLLQQRYGYAKEAAEQEIDKRLKEYADSTKKSAETVKSSSLD